MFRHNKITSFKQKFLIIIFINLVFLLPFLFFDLRILNKIFIYKNRLVDLQKEQQELLIIKEKLLKIGFYAQYKIDSLNLVVESLNQHKDLLLQDSTNIGEIELFFSNLSEVLKTKPVNLQKLYDLFIPFKNRIDVKLNFLDNKNLFYLNSISRVIKILNWLIFFEILIILGFSLFLIYYVPEKFLSSLSHVIKSINYNTLNIGKLEIKKELKFSELSDLVKKLNNIFVRVSNILFEYKQKINHQQKKVDFFIDFLKEPLFFVDENFKLLNFNKLCTQFLGFSTDDLGKSLRYVDIDFFNEIFNSIYNNKFNIKMKSEILSKKYKKDIFFIVKNFEVKSFYQEFLIIIYM